MQSEKIYGRASVHPSMYNSLSITDIVESKHEGSGFMAVFESENWNVFKMQMLLK